MSNSENQNNQNPDDSTDAETAPATIEEMEGKLIDAMERIKVLEDALAESQKELKKALSSSKGSKSVKAVSGKDNLQKAISTLLAGSLDKIDRLLIRAKKVTGGRYKLTTEIKMLEGHEKVEGPLVGKLEGLIEGSKSEYTTLTVCVSQVKGGDPRVSINKAPLT